MRWPWMRHRHNGEAEAAKQEAARQLEAAKQKAPKVDKTVKAANELVNRTDRFAREVERSLHLRRGAT